MEEKLLKFLVCNDCGELVAMRKIGAWQWCLCGNIGGMYVDNTRATVAIDKEATARVIGIGAGVLHGVTERGEVWKQKPGDPATGINVTQIPIEQARREYGWTGESSDTLLIDMAKVVGIVPADGDPCFSEMVFRLIMKADRDNRERLRAIWPVHVEMADRFQLKDGVIAHPQHPEAGMYEPVGDKYQFRYPLEKEKKKE